MMSSKTEKDVSCSETEALVPPSFESSLKKLISKTHRDGQDVEGPRMPELASGQHLLVTPQLQWHFDVCWQVDCVNKSNKKRTQQLADKFAKNYAIIGSYRFGDVNNKLEVFEFPEESALRLGIERIRYKGLRVMTGKWLVPGRPFAILMDLDSVWWAFDRYRADLLNNHGLVIADGDERSREMVLYGFMVAQFVADFNYELVISANVQHRQSKIDANFHEWLTGVGLVLLCDWKVPSDSAFFSHDLSKVNANLFTKIKKKTKK